MFDIFQFPNITGNTTEEKIGQMINYLIQFKEELEFVLTNISAENLSADLQATLKSLGANIEEYKENQEDTNQQMANKTLSVSDVINSTAFKSALKGVSDTIPTEYLKSAKQTVVSEEPNGINIYVITDSNGTPSEFKVKNGKTPTVTFSVNFETGNLEYTSS